MTARIKEEKRPLDDRRTARTLRIDCDVRILLITLVCIGVGASLVASSSSYFAGEHYSDHFALLRLHLVKVAIALVALLLAVNIDYHYYGRVSPVVLVLGVCTLIGLFFFHGSIRDTQRWYYFARLHMALQPSEIVRLSLIIFLAWWITMAGNRLAEFKRGFLPAIAGVSLVAVLIAATPNFGSAIAVVIIALTMLFVGGARILHLGGFVAAAAVAAGVALLKADYARARIQAFLNPGDSVSGDNWQVTQSLIGLGSGGVVGKGLGESTQKLNWLPDSYTDFIFAILGEETGLLGTLLVSTLFLLFALRALKISRRCNDTFGEMLVVGIGCSIFWYAILNMYVATKLFPVTGLPLPFLSYGGSALVVNAFAVGILLNVSKHKSERKKRGRRKLAPAVGEAGL